MACAREDRAQAFRSPGWVAVAETSRHILRLCVRLARRSCWRCWASRPEVAGEFGLHTGGEGLWIYRDSPADENPDNRSNGEGEPAAR